MKGNKIVDAINNLEETEAILLEPQDRYNETVIGYDMHGDRLIYSYKMFIDDLEMQFGDRDQAVEFFDYNVSPSNHIDKPHWPIFLINDLMER